MSPQRRSNPANREGKGPPVSWNFANELAEWGPKAKACTSLAEGEAYCARVTRSHYENFTVASWLLPKRLVPHFEAVYAFCRWSDDLADEVESPEQALAYLDWWQTELLNMYRGMLRHPVMVALQRTVEQFNIPPKPFLNLLVAFRQDQRVREYETFEQLQGYCVNSANPVGHIVLYLFESYSAENAKFSDDICTALQLANFWQDVSRDLDKGRIYLPRQDRESFGYPDEHLRGRRYTQAFRELLAYEVLRTRDLFQSGRSLLRMLPREARVDVSLFILGGEAILRAIEQQDYDVWRRRPIVSKRQKLWLVLRAFLGLS
jgi:squalene synthase HpnC